MHDVAIAVCLLAVLVSLVAGSRTAYRRESGWQQTSSIQFAGAGMVALGVAAMTNQSSLLDLISVGYAATFLIVLLWVQRRLSGKG